ncbi:MAG: hypothetical protein JRF33_06060 [Deltaproteobacteria bacterium]|nr:hypothetical protein [Deltaproteobacteria bacterium]
MKTKAPFPSKLQGITKKRVRAVLKMLDLDSLDMVDTVYALLDKRESLFAKPPTDACFCDGATTAHIGAHVGILQRKGNSKLDREGRDYWLKPLQDIGAIEKVYLDPDSVKFLPGHLKAKSPNCGYKLADDFVEILKASRSDWPSRLEGWSLKDNRRVRAQHQAETIKKAAALVGSGHAGLIQLCIEQYVPKFLCGYQAIYTDDSDGDRITDEDELKLNEAGISIELGDAMPDVLLWNKDTDALWVIEAVTSDGEVDHHKVDQIQRLAKRCGKNEVGFTTAYPTWKVAAARQGKNKNIEPGTFLWIAEDSSKHFRAEAFNGIVENQK